MSGKADKCPGALKLWRGWTQSISKARSASEREHGNIAELASRARFESQDGGKGNRGSVRFALNEEMATLWRIDTSLRRKAERFVSNEIGLEPDSDLYYRFVHYWMQSAFPEFTGEETTDSDSCEEGDPSQRRTWAEYKIIKPGTVDEDIEYVVHWRQSKIKPKQVAKAILRSQWPSSGKGLPERNKGGRPRDTEIPAQAVVCFLLKHRQHLTHKEIATFFNWKTHVDSNGNLMSNTVRNRVTLGRQILEKAKETNTNK